eukprot:354296-Chlamydomonas_euryale.AAC.11
MHAPGLEWVPRPRSAPLPFQPAATAQASARPHTEPAAASQQHVAVSTDAVTSWAWLTPSSRGCGHRRHLVRVVDASPHGCGRCPGAYTRLATSVGERRRRCLGCWEGGQGAVARQEH